MVHVLVLLALVAAVIGTSIAVGAGLLRRPPPTVSVPRTFVATGAMSEARVDAAAATLVDGRVLVVGGWRDLRIGTGRGAPEGVPAALTTAEIFDPETAQFAMTGSMATPRRGGTATTLPDGRVFVVGGFATSATAAGDESLDDALASTEFFDPASGTFSAGPSMLDSRGRHAAVRLVDGSILVLGGIGWTGGSRPAEAGGGTGPLHSAERFDPATGRWERVGDMVFGVIDPHVATLDDGRVIVTDGSSAEVQVYDPTARAFHRLDASLGSTGSTVAVVPDGRVLIVGMGLDAGDLIDGGPRWTMWDPRTGESVGVGPGGFGDHAVVLTDGRVLVLGAAPIGLGLPVEPTAEFFDPADRSVRPAGPMIVARERGQVVATAGDGSVLVAGGMTGSAFDIGDGMPSDYRYTAFDGAERLMP